MEMVIWSLMVLLGGIGLVVPTLDYLKGTKVSPYLALIATALAAVLVGSLIGKSGTLFDGTIRVDPLATYLALIATVGAFLVTVASLVQVREWSTSPSLYSLLLLALLGVYFVLYVNDASVLVAAWALVAVASYVLVGIKKDEDSLEATAKYALMGVASSSLLIFGIALVLGIVKTSTFQVLNSVPIGLKTTLLLGVLMLVAAFGFKLGVVPFHGWLPDVYGGAHPIIVSFVAGVIKLISIGAFLRVLQPLIPAVANDWFLIMAFLSIITMFYGNLAALVQRNVQRMMAYSSIAQAGYFLIAFAALAYTDSQALALQGIGLHVTTYVLAKVGIFVGLAYFARKGFDLTLEGLSGVGRKLPLSGTFVTVLVLSLMGMPPLIGFWSKFMYIFYSVMNVAPWLAFLGIVNSGISVGYYAQVIRYLFFADPPEVDVREEEPDLEVYVLTVTAVLTVLLGLGLVDVLIALLS